MNAWGNFVYTLVGELPLAHVQAYHKFLTEPFGGGRLVTTRGWNWANLKDVILHNPETGVVWEEDKLLKEVRANPMFTMSSICVPPYWLGNPLTFQGERGTVIFAYEDKDNKITEAAISNGVAMFGKMIRFIPMGDVPIVLQCGRWWQLGHRTEWDTCKITGTEVVCYRCGGRHSAGNHDYESTNAQAHTP